MATLTHFHCISLFFIYCYHKSVEIAVFELVIEELSHVQFCIIILNDSLERKLVVVSAMSQVTDMMYNLIYKAQSRDESYVSSLHDIFQKHKLTATDLFDGNDLDRFLAQLHHNISNLKAMLRAIYIGRFMAGCISGWHKGLFQFFFLLQSVHLLFNVISNIARVQYAICMTSTDIFSYGITVISFVTLLRCSVDT
ncbi:uncharacterized protein LOC131255481 isoform X1 [Magnolia sinica]|uniref:uncharacterized protein LOC131255481 isoform X1 n=1 Tax=Magnolia sinica TaxID=86752 RepID=UPI0026581E4E|nr:uncharacterized protein LOC131255481 isoform X1 [Magnolia sinica]XP_058112213.1 uncharacterized protein LOC131255481 isoform X1 [Magnolia sinica]